MKWKAVVLNRSTNVMCTLRRPVRPIRITKSVLIRSNRSISSFEFSLKKCGIKTSKHFVDRVIWIWIEVDRALWRWSGEERWIFRSGYEYFCVDFSPKTIVASFDGRVKVYGIKFASIFFLCRVLFMHTYIHLIYE